MGKFIGKRGINYILHTVALILLGNRVEPTLSSHSGTVLNVWLTLVVNLNLLTLLQCKVHFTYHVVVVSFTFILHF